MGLALLWATNILRLLLIFWVGQKFGEQFAVGILHPVAGLVIFCFGVLLMLAILKPFGLRLADFGSVPRPEHRSVGAAPADGPPSKRPRCQPGRTAGVLGRRVGGRSPVSCFPSTTRRSAVSIPSPVRPGAQTDVFYRRPGEPGRVGGQLCHPVRLNKPFFGTSSVWDRYAYGMNRQVMSPRPDEPRFRSPQMSSTPEV